MTSLQRDRTDAERDAERARIDATREEWADAVAAFMGFVALVGLMTLLLFA